MERVTGLGGVFLTGNDPVALRAWYRDHLGIDVQEWGGAVLPDGSAWSLGERDPATPSGTVTVNYRVADLDGLLAALRDEGCTVLDDTDDSEFGRFGWVIDPEGNKVELWEPRP